MKELSKAQLDALNRPVHEDNLNWRDPKLWWNLGILVSSFWLVTLPKLIIGIVMDIMEYELERPKFLVRLIKRIDR